MRKANARMAAKAAPCLSKRRRPLLLRNLRGIWAVATSPDLARYEAATSALFRAGKLPPFSGAGMPAGAVPSHTQAPPAFSSIPRAGAPSRRNHAIA
jgi:hypothetical protein